MQHQHFPYRQPTIVPALARPDCEPWGRDDHEFRAAVERNTTAHMSRAHKFHRSFVDGWELWCHKRGQAPLPIDHAALYVYFDFLYHKQNRSLPFLLRGYTSINAYQITNGYDPTRSALFTSFFGALRKRHHIHRKTPFSPDDIRALCKHAREYENEFVAARNIAIFLVAYGSACRPSELLGIDVADVRVDVHGLQLFLRKTKTSRPGEITEKRVRRARFGPYCPVAAYLEWIQFSGISSGPVFRGIYRPSSLARKALSLQAFSNLIRSYTNRLPMVGNYGGYSFRRGLATYADQAGAEFAAIKHQLNHIEERTTHIYIDEAPLAWERVPSGLLLP